MPAETFFAPRDDRERRQFVLDEFPFPLALTYARLHVEMDAQEPIAAAWQLRDAMESLLKFSACVAIAVFLQAQPETGAVQALVGLLLKPSGLSLGDWHTLLEKALAPLQPLAAAKRLGDSDRCLPQLYSCFLKPDGKPTPLNLKIEHTDKSFVHWRNQVFGHGVFQNERGWYAKQTLNWLPTLHEFYDALRPVLRDWRLVGLTPGGDQVDWQGCEEPRPTTPHEHQPWGQPLPMRLVSDAARGGKTLPLGPLLAVQRCLICQQPAAFFFDRHDYDRKKDRHDTRLLEYFRGHQHRQRDWPEAVRIRSLLAPTFEWQRTAYDMHEVVEGISISFRDFDKEYVRPAYLLDQVWNTIDKGPRGYLHLEGPGGVGKSFLVRGLAAEGAGRGTPVLVYHIMPGATTDYRTFVSLLADQAHEQLHFRTQEMQTGSGEIAALAREFVEFAQTLMQRNRLQNLVIAIDALDELPEAAGNVATIVDFLPPADQLPEGCYVLLTSRPGLRPRVHSKLDDLRRAGPNAFRLLPLDPQGQGNARLIEEYLAANLPAALREKRHVDAVREKTGGVFLYAYHLARALSSGVYTDTSELPTGDQFYPHYLARLRERVGERLFQDIYLPTLLLLAAAQRPVTREQLERWGIPPDRLGAALLELRDFLRVERTRRWHDSMADDGESRYELAHEEFVRFVAADATLSRRLTETHARIAAIAVQAHAGHRTDLDVSNDVELYHLLHVTDHVMLSNSSDTDMLLLLDPTYAIGCLRAGGAAHHKARHHLAVDLSARAESEFRRLIDEEGRDDLANDLAGARMNKGNALRAVGKLADAVTEYDQAIAIRRRLVDVERREDLAEDLARALANRGGALSSLGRPGDAVTEFDWAIEILCPLVEVAECEETANALAGVRMNKGIALRALGQFTEAVTEYEQAIAIFRRLLAVQDREELAHTLAGTLMNKGILLADLDREMDAVADYDQAIAILRRLVEEQGREEWANDLAAVRMNKGVSLAKVSRLTGPRLLAGAVREYDEAIAIYRRLVEDQGREELARDLATARTNKGNALSWHGLLFDALTQFDKAIAILRPLVEEQGREELAPDLALALVNKGLAIQIDRPDLALGCFAEGIKSLSQCVEAGQVQAIPTLFKAFGFRCVLFRTLRRGSDLAEDVISVLSWFSREQEQMGQPTSVVITEFLRFFLLVRDMEPHERLQLYAALGDHAATVKDLMAQFDSAAQ